MSACQHPPRRIHATGDRVASRWTDIRHVDVSTDVAGFVDPDLVGMAGVPVPPPEALVEPTGDDESESG